MYVGMKIRIQRENRLVSNFRLLKNLFSLDDGRRHVAIVLYQIQLKERLKNVSLCNVLKITSMADSETDKEDVYISL